MKKIIVGLFLLTMSILFLVSIYRFGVATGRLQVADERLKETCINNYFDEIPISSWCLEYIDKLPKTKK